jgi:hypothetical protein
VFVKVGLTTVGGIVKEGIGTWGFKTTLGAYRIHLVFLQHKYVLYLLSPPNMRYHPAFLSNMTPLVVFTFFDFKVKKLNHSCSFLVCYKRGFNCSYR